MSEAITKACETCAGAGWWQAHWGRCDCVDCSGTGRVPDVEATLRAEVARLEKELDIERTWHRSTKLQLSDEHASRQYWEREANTDHRGEAQEAKRNEAHARDMERRVTVALKEVEVENKGLRAEVTRLTAELDDANFARATMIEGCDSLGNRLTAAKAEVARLTAEVERLKGREREAADIIVNDRDLKYSVEYRDESRAAWLAGCKS